MNHSSDYLVVEIVENSHEAKRLLGRPERNHNKSAERGSPLAPIDGASTPHYLLLGAAWKKKLDRWFVRPGRADPPVTGAAAAAATSGSL